MMTDPGLNITRHALAEHHEMDEMIEELTETEFSSPSWIAIAKKLSDKVHHHLKEEEHAFFQQAGKILGDEQKQALADQYKTEYQRYKEMKKTCWLKANIEIQIFIIKKDGQSAIFLYYSAFYFSGFIFLPCFPHGHTH